MRFMATAMVSWVSREMAPRDMPPVQNRLMISSADCTSSMGMAGPTGVSSRQSLSTETGLLSKCFWYAEYMSCTSKHVWLLQNRLAVWRARKMYVETLLNFCDFFLFGILGGLAFRNRVQWK